MHYQDLNLYDTLGIQITNIYRGIEFQQNAFLKIYVNMNTERKTKANRARNELESYFFKLVNNSAYGKTMGNITKRVNIRLVTLNGTGTKLKAKPNYYHQWLSK